MVDFADYVEMLKKESDTVKGVTMKVLDAHVRLLKTDRNGEEELIEFTAPDVMEMRKLPQNEWEIAASFVEMYGLPMNSAFIYAAHSCAFVKTIDSHLNLFIECVKADMFDRGWAIGSAETVNEMEAKLWEYFYFGKDGQTQFMETMKDKLFNYLKPDDLSDWI